MTTPSWPASAINSLAERGSWSLDMNEPVLRSEFDYGPARTRRRFTRQVQQFSFTVVMSNDEYMFFEAFYYDELASGAAWFTMPVYVGRVGYEIKKVRFVEPPKVSDQIFGHVSISAKLEMMNTPIVSSGAVMLLDIFGEETLFSIADALDVVVNTQYFALTLGD